MYLINLENKHLKKYKNRLIRTCYFMLVNLNITRENFLHCQWLVHHGIFGLTVSDKH